MKKKVCENGHQYTGDQCPYCPNPNEDKILKNRIFGTTIRETIYSLNQINQPKGINEMFRKNRKIVFLRIIISFLVFIAAFVFLLEGDKGTGTGLLGTVVGYWLK